MIRTYKIINIIHKSEFDMEALALVRDIELQEEFYVVINDHSVDHLMEHEYGIYNLLKENDLIKGELMIIEPHIIETMGDTYFAQNITISDLMNSPSFEGEMKVYGVDNGRTVLEYPDGDTLFCLDCEAVPISEDSIRLRGELFLDTIGIPFTED